MSNVKIIQYSLFLPTFVFRNVFSPRAFLQVTYLENKLRLECYN